MVALRKTTGVFLLCAAVVFPVAGRAQSQGRGELAGEPLVDIAKIDPSIFIELRYATSRNISGHPIYPPGTPCMLRRGVAGRLKEAQAYVQRQGYSLKIWDAYRPAAAQQILWDLVKNPEVVADPSKGGSRHTWGVAVDVTLVGPIGQDLLMPTDFDDFTAAAKSDYKGNDPIVAKNLRLLRNAMEIAGFEGMRDEWWHFSAKNWRSYAPVVTMEAASPSPAPSPSPAALSAPTAAPVPLVPSVTPTPSQ